MPESGQLVGSRYRLIQPLGIGGMAAVWRAEHIAMGRAVALKIIAPDLLDHPLALARFRSEARAAASLQSRHVVQIFDYDVDPVVGPYIVMELLEGESLEERLQRLGVVGPRDVIAIVTQVARGLARAHAASIIHRDLKPANIFLVPDEDGSEVAKVLDFGVAKVPLAASAGLTTAGLLVGTLSHMSPEQATGRTIDHRADLYSLGIIAYQCLTGQIPFEQDTVGAWIVAICTSPLPIPSSSRPDLPLSFDAWFARACHRDPAERFQSAQELAAALERSLLSRPRLVLEIQPESMAPEPQAPALPAGEAYYYVSSNDTTVGPVEAPLLKRAIAAGKVPRSALIWRESWPEWRSLDAVVDELAPVAIPAGSAPPSGNGLLALGRPSLPPRHAPSTLPAGRIELRAPRAPGIEEAQSSAHPAADLPCFYVAEGDAMVGPVSSALLRKGLEVGRVAPSARVWRDGWDRWRPVEEVVQFVAPESASAAKLLDRPGLHSIGAPSLLPPSAPPSIRAAAPRSATISFVPEFYVADGGITVGPVSATLLRRGLETRRVPETALVWADGWDAWRPVTEIAPELERFVSTTPEQLRSNAGIEALGSPSIAPAYAPPTWPPKR